MQISKFVLYHNYPSIVLDIFLIFLNNLLNSNARVGALREVQKLYRILKSKLVEVKFNFSREAIWLLTFRARKFDVRTHLRMCAVRETRFEFASNSISVFATGVHHQHRRLDVKSHGLISSRTQSWRPS